MLLLIVFLLSSHVLCTIRDESLTRLVREGFQIADEVMATDSRRFERVVSQFRGPEGPLVDVVPSWLLGGEDGTSVEIRLGDPGRDAPVYPRIYHIQGRDNWFIHYSRPERRLAGLQDLAANESLRGCRYTLPVDVLYFSRPDPDTEMSWVYTIFDLGPHRRMLDANPIMASRWMFQTRLSLRQKSHIIEAMMVRSLRIRRCPCISDYVLLADCAVNPPADNPVLFMATHVPVVGRPRNEVAGITRTVEDVLVDMARVIHSDGISWYHVPNRDYEDQFLRHALFLDSESPEPLVHPSGFSYHFISLEQVRGDEFSYFHAREIRSCFVEFVDEFRRAWEQPGDDTEILSIVERIEQLPMFLIL
jgi:hypothetical protein